MYESKPPGRKNIVFLIVSCYSVGHELNFNVILTQSISLSIKVHTSFDEAPKTIQHKMYTTYMYYGLYPFKSKQTQQLEIPVKIPKIYFSSVVILPSYGIGHKFFVCVKSWTPPTTTTTTKYMSKWKVINCRSRWIYFVNLIFKCAQSHRLSFW